MSTTNDGPRVSVVMSVYNGEAHLEKTIDSILRQTVRDFEFVIVNDGSTDSSQQILQSYQQQDPRVKIINQRNEGLTKALNTGCSAARGAIVARQDVGDRSLPERLEEQCRILEDDQRIVAVGVGSRRVGPEAEYLGDQFRDLSPEEVTQALWDSGTGLLHPASAFRRHAFERVGRYRPEFRFAQDTDLWYRMSEIGLLAESPKILFELIVETSGISGTQTPRQILLAALAKEAYLLRRKGMSDALCLQRAVEVSLNHGSGNQSEASDQQAARAAYFIGSQLFELRDSRCRNYLARSLKPSGSFLPALVKYLASFAVCREQERNSNVAEQRS